MYSKAPFFFAGLIWMAALTGGFAQPNEVLEFIKLRHEPNEFARLEVTDILQDRFGFLWFATTKGLVRYDGHDLKTYRENPLDPYSIGSNFLRKLAEDESGDLWIASGEGALFRYWQQEDTFMAVPFASGDRSSGEINDLLIDRRGRLWCATDRGLEYIEDGRRVVYFDTTSVLNTVKINCLNPDARGRIWIGTQGEGLHVLDPATRQTEKYSGNSNTEVYSVILDITTTPDSRLWFSTEAPALHALHLERMDLQTFSFPEVEKAGGNTLFREMISDREGSLWLATWDNGLIHFVPETEQVNHYIRTPEEPYSISSSSVSALYFDRQQVLWLGFNGDGVDQVFENDDKGFEQLPLSANNPAPNFYPNYRCMLEDSRGIIWAGTIGNGLYRYDVKTKALTQFLHQPYNPQSLANNMVWDLMEDEEGFLWVATHNGLQRLDTKTFSFKTFRSESGLVENAIRSLHQDHRGRIWIGTFGGLHRLDVDTETIQFVNEYFDQPNFVVLDILEDSDRRLWVAGFGKGLYRIDAATNRVEHFLSDKSDLGSLSSNIVLTIREDQQRNLWLATQGGGLCRFASKADEPDASSFTHWRSYNSELPDDDVFGLAVGDNDQLWLATGAGLYSFDTQGQEVKSYTPPGRRRVLRFVERSDGAPALYAASGKEIYRFQPDSINRNASIPPVYVTDIYINGEPLSIQRAEDFEEKTSSNLVTAIEFIDSLNLKHWQNALTFEFSALNFIQSEKNRYKFKLEGYDDDWIETDAWNRRIRYTNLAHGHYQFRVIASNNDGVWNETGKTLIIKIAPPWWRTWWAYLGYALLAFLLIRTLYLFQLRRRLAQAEAKRLQELDTAKTRLFTNVTHEFRTPLTVILGMAQQVKDDPKEWFSEGMDAILRNGKQVLHLVNQMLDLSRLETGHLPVQYQQADIIAYIGYLVQSFQSFAASRQIDLQFIKGTVFVQMDFDPDLLAKVVNNLLSNAIKFTPEGGKVKVKVKEDGSWLKIDIEDNGVGIPEAYLPHIFDRFYQIDNSSVREGEGTGIGLALVKEIVDKIDGRIQVTSEPDFFTRFQLTLPIRREAPLTEVPARTEILFTEFGAPPESMEVGSTGEGRTVLIIEDNPDVARYTAGCLQDSYAVQIAPDGRAGLEKAIEVVPDLIICDVMMPEMDGYEVCHRLKNDERTSHIPIVMLTAKADVDSRLEGLRRGADAYLAKPFNRQELELRLDNLLALRKKIQQHFSTFPESSRADDPGLRQEDAFLQKLKAAILSRISDEDFGIPEICRELAVSRAQLHRKLKALTGRSASHVVRSIRLQRAKELLLSSDRNISEIAYQTGFKNPSHFTAVFAEEFGQTPTEMRERTT